MDDQEHEPNENGGFLFSDDYEIPKRENPYLKKKKNKPKPTDEGKTAQNCFDGDPSVSSKPKNPYTSRSKQESPSLDNPNDPIEVPKSSKFGDFMFKHIRLIVFIVCVTVVIMILGPFSVFRIAEYVEEKRIEEEMATKDALTVGHIEAFMDAHQPLVWSAFERFFYEDRGGDDFAVWLIPVEQTYELWIGGADTHSAPMYVYLYEKATGDRVDLLTEELDDFLHEHP